MAAPGVGNYTNFQSPFPAALPPDVRKRLCPSGDCPDFFMGLRPSGQIFNHPSPRLCRLMCGRGFALPETAPIFLWGCAPPVWSCGKSSNRVAYPSFCLIPKQKGVAQNKNASLTEGQSLFRTSGGQAAKASYRTCASLTEGPSLFRTSGSRAAKASHRTCVDTNGLQPLATF
jgi:hypothetical protein